MAYQNIPVDNGYQVAQQMANFAGTVGWTVHRASEQTDVNGSTSYFEVTLSATGYPGYVTLAGYTGGVTLNGHRSYDSTKRWWEQPNQYFAYDNDGDFSDSSERATRVHAELRVNPIMSVHLFGGLSPTPYLYAAIEKEPGYYRHIAIGHLQKFGTSLGGLFWDVSSRRRYNGSHSYYERHRPPLLYNNRVQDDNYSYCGGFDTQRTDGTPYFNRIGSDYYNPHGVGGHPGNELYSVMVASPIAFNGRTPLQTPMVFANTYTPFGTPTAMRYVNLGFFEAGDELVIGNETWKVFPWARRASGVRNSDYVYSGPEYEATSNYGIAYLKD